MKRLCFLILAAILAGHASADVVATPLVIQRNVSAASYTYCVIGREIAGNGSVTTAGASTTVTANTTTAYDPIAVEDLIIFYPTTGATSRSIGVKTDGDTLTINGATVNFATPTPWGYRSYGPSCGTGLEAGWVSVKGRSTVYVSVADLNATSIDYSIEYRAAPAAPIVGVQGTITSEAFGTNAVKFDTPSIVVQIRVGLKVTGDVGLQDVTAVIASETP